MGRHGTGGSDEANEGGMSRSEESQDEDLRFTTDPAAAWSVAPDPTATSSFFGPDSEEPGWPAPPDQLEVTGQWTPAPNLGPGQKPRPPHEEPFETTGAFTMPQQPEPRGQEGGPSGPFETGAFAPPQQRGPFAEPPRQQSGPFETTGAFTAPQQPEPFAGPRGQEGQQPGPRGQEGRPSGPFETGVFAPPPSANTGPFGQPPADGTDPFSRPRQDGTGPFAGPPVTGGDPFARPHAGGAGGYERPDGPRGDASDLTQTFAPGPGAAFGDGPTAAFDGSYDGQAGEPPEPGDVKVFGSPTVVAPTPAWADRADDGLLGAGWSGDDELADLEEPSRRRRGRRRPGARDDVPGGSSGGGRARVALLSVAAVAVVLGGTVAGVNLMGASNNSPQCPNGNCAAVQGSNNQPAPQVTDTGEPEEEPTEEPTEEEEDAKPSESATPSPTTSVRPPRRTSTPKPTPTKTKQKNTSKPTEEPEPEPTLDPTETDTPTDQPSGTGEPSTGIPRDTLAPVPTTSTGTQQAPSGGSVNVKFDLVKQAITGYKASIDVVNSSTQPMSTLTLSLPVSGRVLDVNGADWTQDGELLIIDVTETLASGAAANVTFTATGKAAQPENCGLVGGECALT